MKPNERPLTRAQAKAAAMTRSKSPPPVARKVNQFLLLRLREVGDCFGNTCALDPKVPRLVLKSLHSNRRHGYRSPRALSVKPKFSFGNFGNLRVKWKSFFFSRSKLAISLVDHKT